MVLPKQETSVAGSGSFTNHDSPTISTLEGMSAMREDLQELHLLSLSSGSLTLLFPWRRLTTPLILSSGCGSLQTC